MTDPAQPRPRPVVNAARIGGLVSAAFVAVGGTYFVISQGVTRDNLSTVGLSVEGAITALIALGVYVSAVVHGKAAEALVTPLAAPQDDQGRPLVVDPAVYGRHASRFQTALTGSRVELQAVVPVPAPFPPAPAPVPAPGPAGPPLPAEVLTWAERTAAHSSSSRNRQAAQELLDWLAQQKG